MRYLAYSEQLGICLGECLGMIFWSGIDPVGQTHAVTFDSEADVLEYCRNIRDVQAVPVETTERYLPMAGCEAVGLPGWEVQETV